MRLFYKYVVKEKLKKGILVITKNLLTIDAKVENVKK